MATIPINHNHLPSFADPCENLPAAALSYDSHACRFDDTIKTDRTYFISFHLTPASLDQLQAKPTIDSIDNNNSKVAHLNLQSSDIGTFPDLVLL
jgi:hypothetical protein